MTTNDLLNTLNTLRAANGKPPLKSWKESRAKLQAAIDALTPASALASAPAAPKAARVKSDRRDAHTEKLSELSAYLRTNNINPKVARAKLRRAGLKAPYTLNQDVIAILTGDRRKK